MLSEIKKEVDTLVNLKKPTEAEPLEKRKIRNAQLRELISQSSDEVIAWACVYFGTNNLVEKELLKRLKVDKKSIPIEPLFWLTTSHWGSEWVNLVRENIARYVPTAPQEEIINAVNGYVNTLIQDDINLVTEVMALRDDRKEIVEKIINTKKPCEDTVWRLNMLLDTRVPNFLKKARMSNRQTVG